MIELELTAFGDYEVRDHLANYFLFKTAQEAFDYIVRNYRKVTVEITIKPRP